MRRILLTLAAMLALAGCGADHKWASDAEVQAARYHFDGPPSITLFTVINNHNGDGAHSGLLISGSERVMFDPAGTWYHPNLPERNDVHFGVTPKMVSFYIDYHARETFRVVEQTLVVSPEVAELALQRVLGNGSASKAMCAQSVSSILNGVPGFETIPRTWFPKRIMEAFGELPGVSSRTIRDEDADNNHGVLMVQAQGSPA